MNDKTITIFGTANAKSGEPAYTLAYQTGKLLAQAGFVIANGGYGGTMLAASKGATEAGGETIGVPAQLSHEHQTNISAVKLLPIRRTNGSIR